MSTTEPRVTGVEDAAQVGPADAPATKADPAAVAALVPRLREICGDEHVITGRDQLRTYESDGLLQYEVTPGAVVLPGSHGGGRRGRAGVLRARGPVGRPRRRLRAQRRRAARRARHRDRAEPAAQGARGRPPQPARRRRAGRHEHRGLPRGRADALLPARPVEPDRLLDRRQRRGELRRRALLQVRLHDELRLRPGGRPLRRRGRPDRRQATRRAGLRPARRARRLRGHARGRHQASSLRVMPVPESIRTLVAFFGPRGGRRGGVGDRPGRRRPGRDRDDGQPRRSRPPS